MRRDRLSGDEVRILRRQTGLPQTKFAAALGISPRTVQDWEGSGPKGAPWYLSLAVRTILREQEVEGIIDQLT